MKAIDGTVLFALANALSKDDLGDDNMASMPEDIKQALATLRAEERAESAKKAARLIVEVYKGCDEQIKINVDMIRRARRAEAAAKAKIEKLNRAKAYGEETNNYLPLATETGNLSVGTVRDIDIDIFNVPVGWVSKKESKISTAKSKAK